MKIMKFGGSSLGTPESIKHVMGLIKQSQKKTKVGGVVVSAFGGITNALEKAARLAQKRDLTYKDIYKDIRKRHITTIKKLTKGKRQEKTLERIERKMSNLAEILHGIFLIKEASPRTLDYVMSFGERFSAYIISKALAEERVKADYCNACKLIVTDENYGTASVDFHESVKNIQAHHEKNKNMQIITGFIAANRAGEITALGRGGSDYTASIFAAALGAKEVEKWTDVDGMITADPRKVDEAFPIPTLSYEEALELSHFGAKVLYPPAIQPAITHNIPFRIRSTFNPDFAGSVISTKPDVSDQKIRGISSIDNITLLRIEGPGIIGLPEFSRRLFGVIDREKINVFLITQASSERTICLAVMPEDAHRAKKHIEEEFKHAIKDKMLKPVICEEDLSIISIVGESMRNTPGIASKYTTALSRQGISIVAIAQGSSELNISVVIPREQEVKALNAIHEAFFFPKRKTIHIMVVGTGLIGSTLLEQIKKEQKLLESKYHIRLRLVGLANSKGMYVNGKGIALSGWEKKLKKQGKKTNLAQFIEDVKALELPNTVFVDCTASEHPIKHYEKLLTSSIAVVTPNKKANSASYELFEKLKETSRQYQTSFQYETNVGAGLPIIGTITDLRHTGDKIEKIEAILSGTLSYIFNNFTGDAAFSDVVKMAKEKGYTEPDPRDDLNGMDVARKLLILARKSGVKLEMKELKVENLIPKNCQSAKTVDDFFKKLTENDKHFEKLKKKAEKEGKVLRYIAKFEKGKGSIALTAVDQNHPFYNMSGSDNIIAFHTTRYSETPLVVKGPGAGAAVTAAGVFADILKTF